MWAGLELSLALVWYRRSCAPLLAGYREGGLERVAAHSTISASRLSWRTVFCCDTPVERLTRGVKHAALHRPEENPRPRATIRTSHRREDCGYGQHGTRVLQPHRGFCHLTFRRQPCLGGVSDDPVADPPPGSVVVTLMSEEVAGTGAHPTTELCLDTMLDRLSPPPRRLLDVGCGSGILSIVAAKLGVPEITAIDIDPGSVRVAREAVMLNGVGSQVTALDVAVCDLDETFPWVVANITASVLIDLAGCCGLQSCARWAPAPVWYHRAPGGFCAVGVRNCR